MGNIRRFLTVSFVVLLIAGITDCSGMPGSRDGEADILYVFNLNDFLDRLGNSVAQYDYFKLATALQGLANRDKPQIYFMYKNTTFNDIYGFEVDDFWLKQLSARGRYLSQYRKNTTRYRPTIDGFFRLMQDFSAYYEGFVLWDHDVPATANVSSTIAGVQNLLPVRLYQNSGSLYNALFTDSRAQHSLDSIKMDLTGKFTNNADGTIWDTDIPSTGSAKNDAYLWAIEKYLDTGLTNPLRTAYCLDSWVKSEIGENDDVEFVSVNLPDRMYPDQTMTVRITIRNKTNELFHEGEYLTGFYRLGTTWGNMFVISNQKDGGISNNPEDARMYIGGTVPPDSLYTFEFDITAPRRTGPANLVLQMVQDGVRWMDGTFTASIEITNDAPRNVTEIPAERDALQFRDIIYRNMFETTLANADFHIAKKAFFWDLSPDDTIAPVDDRVQKIGEDVRTLNKLLLSQARQSGFTIFNVSGFVPWNYKYTDGADPGFSTLGGVASEWLMINRLSSYGGQTEADANATVGDVSNLSVLSHVPLNGEFKQRNDKGSSSNLVYDPDTHYFAIYMGDYDSASWTSSILSMLWENSKRDRGKYPLTWPLATGISDRIPHLFNYIYENATRNDFFVAGNNGTAYLNATMLEDGRRGEGMPDNMLQVWEKHNIEYNKRFDLDIMGLYINTDRNTLSTGTLSRPLRESLSHMYTGVSSQTENGYPRYMTFTENPESGTVTPFINYWGIGNTGDSAQQIAQYIYNTINPRNGAQRTQRFHNFRCILIPPDVINEALDILAFGEAGDITNLKYKVVDPYTLYRMALQSQTQ